MKQVNRLYGCIKSDGVAASSAKFCPVRFVSRSALAGRTAIVLLVIVAPLWATTFGQVGSGAERAHEPQLRCPDGLVVSVSAPASNIGAAILRRGGNAVDAAVATAFALAVTYPPAGNIGGGGYLLAYCGGSDPVVFDFREMAPLGATKEMFVKPEDRTGHRRVGVPGTVRGLALAHERCGTLPWEELISPAVQLAKDGFSLDEACSRSFNDIRRLSSAPEHAELRRILGKPDGGEWQPGDRLVQPELAKTLALIARDGPDAFYTGIIADQIADEMNRGGGLITKNDLAQYRAIVRAPLHGTYRGYDLYCVPPSSSGGTTLIEALNILETFDIRKKGRWSPDTLHLMVEAMKRAYCDRAKCLGDPEFVAIPEKLITKGYARELAAGIQLTRATSSIELAGEIPLAEEGEHTTHLSVVDHNGMVVSLTYTLESNYGSRVVVRGAGFILNDEMNDFGWLPGVTDATGRIGTLPNQIAPCKRMLSSMCPTVVVRNGKPLLVTGSPGGRTIINTVLCVIVNMIDFDMDIRSAVDAPRIHHQWLPDRIGVEPELATGHPRLLQDLKRLGHEISAPRKQGDAHSIWIDPQTALAVGGADRRISGKASFANSHTGE